MTTLDNKIRQYIFRNRNVLFNAYALQITTSNQSTIQEARTFITNIKRDPTILRSLSGPLPSLDKKVGGVSNMFMHIVIHFIMTCFIFLTIIILSVPKDPLPKIENQALPTFFSRYGDDVKSKIHALITKFRTNINISNEEKTTLHLLNECSKVQKLDDVLFVNNESFERTFENILFESDELQLDTVMNPLFDVSPSDFQSDSRLVILMNRYRTNPVFEGGRSLSKITNPITRRLVNPCGKVALNLLALYKSKQIKSTNQIKKSCPND